MLQFGLPFEREAEPRTEPPGDCERTQRVRRIDRRSDRELLSVHGPFGLEDGRLDARKALMGPRWEESINPAVDQLEAFERRIIAAEYRRLDVIQAEDDEVCDGGV